MKLAIFDFDGTLFPYDTLPFLLSQWKKQQYPIIPYLRTLSTVVVLYIQYKTGIRSRLSREQMRQEAMFRFNRIFTAMSETKIDTFFENCAAKMTQLLNFKVVNEMKRSQQEGYHIVLLSGCYEKLLHMIFAPYHVDHIIGTAMYFTDGVIDANRKMEVVTGETKMQKIMAYYANERVDWNASTAYADSYSDLPVLEAVGHAVAVGPEPKLKAVAEENNWRIVD